MGPGGIRLDFIEDGVALVTMCNGENKFNPDYVQRWHEVLDGIESKDDVRGMITIGSDRYFSTGMDVEWLRRSSPSVLDLYHDDLHRLYTRILTLGVTSVAVVNGHAVAEGAFIALVHDFRVMRSNKGWLTWPEVHMKLPMTNVMLDIIRAKVPPGIAQRDAFVFGKRLDANTAQTLGLVDKVAPAEQLLSEAKDTIKLAHGKNGLAKDIINIMKKDIYDSDTIGTESRTKSQL